METTNLKLSFSIDDVGHSMEVTLEDEHLKIFKHQEIVFEGTIGGFKNIVDGKVEHDSLYQYLVILRKISNILDRFIRKLK